MKPQWSFLIGLIVGILFVLWARAVPSDVAGKEPLSNILALALGISLSATAFGLLVTRLYP